MKKEKKAFLEMLRISLNGSDTQKLKSILEQCSLEKLESIAWKSGIDGFLYAAFQESDFGSAIDPSFLQSLHKRAGLAAIRNLTIRQELLALSDAMNTLGVKHVFLKGIQLVERTYGDLSYRAVSDIDLLVERNCCADAVNLLKESGYLYCEAAIRKSFTDYNMERAINELNEVPFIKTEKPFDILVDIHLGWILFLPDIQLNDIFPVEGLDWLGSKVHMEVQGKRIPCLDNESELMHMIFHYAFHHRFIGVKWLLDICLFVKKNGLEIDWQKLNKSLSHPSLRKTFGLCLLLARDISGQELVTERHLNEFCRGSRFRLLVHMIRNRLFISNQSIGSILYEGLLMVSLASGFQDKTRLLRYLLFDKGFVRFRLGEKGRRLPAILVPFYKILVKRNKS